MDVYVDERFLVTLNASHLSASKLIRQLSSNFCRLPRSLCRILASSGDFIFWLYVSQQSSAVDVLIQTPVSVHLIILFSSSKMFHGN